MTDPLSASRRDAVLDAAGRLLGVPRWDPGAAVLGDRATGAEIATLDGRTLIDLTAGSGTRLLAADDPRVTAAVCDAAGRGLPDGAAVADGVEVASRLLRAFPSAERVALCRGHGEALRLALRVARAATGRERVVRLLPDAPEPEGPAIALDAPEALDALGDEVAVVVARPAAADDAAAEALRAVARRATAAGAVLVLDESETAFRCAPAAAHTALGLAPDLVVLGPEIAHGLPLGAVLGHARLLEPLGPRFTAPAVSLAAAKATLDVLAAEPVHARCAERGEQLRSAFDAACVQHAIRARAEGPAGRLRLRFEGQENADGPRIGQAFVDEARRAGVLAGSILFPSAALDEEAGRRAAAALAHAVARLRTLLVEHNSYLSGGLSWPFAARPEAMAARGLAVYRYPERGPVSVTAEEDRVRIRFERGPLGDVTSSGFYAPTLLRGDFAITLRYRLGRWSPGPSSACLALFVQDEGSVLRYYSQRRSAGRGVHEVLGNFNNADMTTPRPARSDHGAFRLVRRGDVVAAAHRDGDGPWVELGSHRGDPPRDVVMGAKIWSSGGTEGLEAELLDLTVEAEISADQLPPVPVRPDPRA